MKLKNILSNVDYKISGYANDNTDIKDITYNSKTAGKDIMFVCLVGTSVDGHKYAQNAYDNGSRVFVCQREIDLPKDAITILVEDTRKALAKISANFFKHPIDSVKLIGVTGTKGKTSIVNFTKSVLENCGVKVGCIGTIGATWMDKRIETVNTTPESYEIQRIIRAMVDDGCTVVAIEVSSIGVMMNRTEDINFDIGVFTNISSDHIGGNEHKTFEEYYGYKKQFFNSCDYAIGCIDDKACEDMISGAKEKVYYGLNQKAEISASNIKPYRDNNILGSQFDLEIKGEEYKNLKISMPGKYNVYNILAVIGICEKLGVDINKVCNSLIKLQVKGRTEIVLLNDEHSIIIDYAHNGESLKKLLFTMKEYNPKRIICLFGSVGDRAQLRRKEMGLVAGELCDLCILTSDDPNFEDPQQIVDEIGKYVEQVGGKCVKIVDRAEAINYAVDILQQGDMLILSGKGHEKFQKIKGELVPFDGKKCVTEALKKKDK